MKGEELRELCNLLADLQRERRYQLKKRQTARAQCEALVRNNLGYQTTMPKDERMEVCALSLKVVVAIKNGEPIPVEAGWSDALKEDMIEIVKFTQKMFDGFDKAKKTLEKKQEKAAKKLPIWEWADNITGLGALSIAQIVGEAGEDREDYEGIGIGQFRNPSCLWKWFCLHVNEGEAGQDAAHYRKGIMYSIADPLIKLNKGEFRQAYDDRRQRTKQTHPDWSKMQSHLDGIRILEKHLLKRIWQKW